jgi:hypothetical protein
MLKKSLVLAAVLAATISSYGQGVIVFNTQATGQRITDAAGVNLSGAAYSAQLYGSATADGSLEPIGKSYGFRAGVNAGYVSVPAAEQPTTVPSATNGGATYLQIRAWDATHASYDAAVAAGGLAGSSATWTQDTGAVNAQPPEPPPGIAGFAGFALVPEPSVLALMGVGAAALLFRRRK